MFQVDADGNGEVLVATSSQPDVAMVTGLLPFLEYFFVLEACTSQGCTRSTSGSVFTQEGGKCMCVCVCVGGGGGGSIVGGCKVAKHYMRGGLCVAGGLEGQRGAAWGSI